MFDEPISRREFPGRLGLWAASLAVVAKGLEEEACASKSPHLGYEVLQIEEERGTHHPQARDNLSMLVRKAKRKYEGSKKKGHKRKVGAVMDTLDSYFYEPAGGGCSRRPKTDPSVRTFGHSLESAVPTETGMLFAAYTLLEALRVIPQVYKFGCPRGDSEIVIFKEKWGNPNTGGTRVFVVPYRPNVIQVEADMCGGTNPTLESVSRGQIIALVDDYLPQRS